MLHTDTYTTPEIKKMELPCNLPVKWKPSENLDQNSITKFKTNNKKWHDSKIT